MGKDTTTGGGEKGQFPPCRSGGVVVDCQSARLACARAGTKGGALTVDKEGVGDVGVSDCSAIANNTGNALRLAEKNEDLVDLLAISLASSSAHRSTSRDADQVRSEIVRRSRPRPVLLLPHFGRRSLALEPIEVRLELGQLAELALVNELLDGEEVGVEAPVLVDSEHEVLLLSESGELVSLLAGRRERLLDHNVLASIESGLWRDGRRSAESLERVVESRTSLRLCPRAEVSVKPKCPD